MSEVLFRNSGCFFFLSFLPLCKHKFELKWSCFSSVMDFILCGNSYTVYTCSCCFSFHWHSEMFGLDLQPGSGPVVFHYAELALNQLLATRFIDLKHIKNSYFYFIHIWHDCVIGFIFNQIEARRVLVLFRNVIVIYIYVQYINILIDIKPKEIVYDRFAYIYVLQEGHMKYYHFSHSTNYCQ